jgi:hypothetical protein
MEYKEIKEKAEQFVKEHYPSDCEILFEEPKESPYGWYFAANVRDPNGMMGYIGDGGFFINGATGEIIRFSSGELINKGLHWWLDIYSRGFKRGNYKLVIEEVYNFKMTLSMIDKQRLYYVIPEVEGEVLYRIPKKYDLKILTNRLKDLPCTFSTLSVENIIDVIEESERGKYCKYNYSYIGSIGETFEWRASKASEKDKLPIW